MLIENKSFDDITSEDIELLVGQIERNRLEFKEQIPDSWKMLREVCAMANSDGGLIIFGAKEKNEECVGFKNIDDIESQEQAIRQSILDNIEERIFEFVVKRFELNDKINVLVIFIPSSFNKPHMIKKDKKTEFWKRYGTDKRTMTIAEIRGEFQNQLKFSNIESIEEKINLLNKTISKQQSLEEDKRLSISFSNILKIKDISIFLERIDNEFKKALGKRRALRLTITPKPVREMLFEPDDEELKELLRKPPNQRYAGWNMENIGNFQISNLGILQDNDFFRELNLFKNGHFEFVIEVNERFSHRQDPNEFKSHPLLWPYCVTEYPVSFYRFSKVIFEYLNYNGNYYARMEYHNIKDCKLNPWYPDAYGFPGIQSKIFTVNDANFDIELENNFNPDQAAYKLLTEFYNFAGFSKKEIPFFDKEGNFKLPKE